MKRVFSYLSGVLFLTLLIVTTVCAENKNSSDNHQTKLLGGVGNYTSGSGIVVDDAGKCYITGYTEGNLYGEKLIGKRDAYIVKYDANGNKEWIRLLGISGKYTCGNSIVIDNVGNSYITGYTSGNLDGQIKKGTNDAFVVKYDANGNKQWTKLLGATGGETLSYNIKIDSLGNCYIVGHTNGNLDGQIKTGNEDAFFVKYDRNGNKRWTKLLGIARKNTTGNGIAIDSLGNCYITGSTDGNLDGQIKTGNYDAFIVKYDKAGNKQGMAKLFGVVGNNTYGLDIAIDIVDNCYITGEIDKVTTIGDVDAYIVKYDRDLIKQVTTKIGVDKNYTSGRGIVIDSASNCYIVGHTNGNLDGQIKTGETDAYILKYDKDLIKQGMAKLFGVAEKTTRGINIALDSAGNCYIIGDTDGNLDGQTKTGEKDAFVISKFNL